MKNSKCDKLYKDPYMKSKFNLNDFIMCSFVLFIVFFNVFYLMLSYIEYEH